jgi:SAM-dependent methyltransferase
VLKGHRPEPFWQFPRLYRDSFGRKYYDMHPQSMLRMEWFVKQFLLPENGGQTIKILDVGSYDVNGSYRRFFPQPQFDYTGMDMVPGPNVDVVLHNPYDWETLATDSFDVIVSGQTFEHNEFFWVTLAEMARVLKKGGKLCIVAPNQVHEHRYPVDCYRFYTDGMVSLARYIQFKVLHAHVNRAPSIDDLAWYTEVHADAMLVAEKPYDGPTQLVDLKRYVCEPADLNEVGRPLVSRPETWKTRFRMKAMYFLDKWTK